MPEQHGGFGAHPVDLVIAFEVLGRLRRARPVGRVGRRGSAAAGRRWRAHPARSPGGPAAERSPTGSAGWRPVTLATLPSARCRSPSTRTRPTWSSWSTATVLAGRCRDPAPVGGPRPRLPRARRTDLLARAARRPGARPGTRARHARHRRPDPRRRPGAAGGQRADATQRVQFGRRSAASRPSSTCSPTWRSAWTWPGRCWTPRPLRWPGQCAPELTRRLGCEGRLHRGRVPGRPHRAAGARRDRLHQRVRPRLWLTKIRALLPAWGTQAQHRARGPGGAPAGTGGGHGAGADDRPERGAARAARRGARLLRPTAGRRQGAGYDAGLWQRLCRGRCGRAGRARTLRRRGAGPVETHLVAEELGRELTGRRCSARPCWRARRVLARRRAVPRLPRHRRRLGAARSPGLAGGGHWDAADAARAGDATEDGWELPAWRITCSTATGGVLLVAARTGRDRAVRRGPAPGRVLPDRRCRHGPEPRVAGSRAEWPAPGEPSERYLPRRWPAPVTWPASRSARSRWARRTGAGLTVELHLTRVQFGRAIGSFQALQHRMADLYVLVESARSLSYAAGARRARRERPISGCGPRRRTSYCSEALARPPPR